MPEIVTSMPRTAKRGINTLKYLDDLMDGKIRKFVAGKDFTCNPLSKANALRTAISRRGGVAEIRTVGDDVYCRAIVN